MKIMTFRWAIAVSALCICAAAVEAGFTYRFTAINDPIGPNTETNGINAAGLVVGTYGTAELVGLSAGDHAFLLKNGTFQNIDFPGAAWTDGNWINNSNHIVGVYGDSQGVWHGYLLFAGTDSSFDVPGSFGTAPFGINNAGTISGFYCETSGCGSYNGFLLENGVYHKIAPPFAPAGTSLAVAVNDSDQVVGFYFGTDGSHGWLKSGSTYSHIDFPGAISTGPVGINNAGEIVGGYCMADCNGIINEQGFVYKDGVYKTVDFPTGAIGSAADAINDAGVITGLYWDSATVAHGYQAVPSCSCDPVDVSPPNSLPASNVRPGGAMDRANLPPLLLHLLARH